MTASKIHAAEATVISQDAFVFGYPLVLMDITRRLRTATPRVTHSKAPINQFLHQKKLPEPAFSIVPNPNADMLYSEAWLDLKKEPMILSVPETDRYYMIEILDMWTNVFAARGTRTTGNGKRDFAISGPLWKRKLPGDVQEIKSPTNIVWLRGSMLSTARDDYRSIYAIQDQYRLTPLSEWGNDYTPRNDVRVDMNIDTRMPAIQQLAELDPISFFNRLNALMKDNPPAPADEESMTRFSAIGIVPGKKFEKATAEIAGIDALQGGILSALSRIRREAEKSQGKQINGWHITYNTGRYATDYLLRAATAMMSLGANLPEDAIYSRATADVDGQPLIGSSRYVLRFSKSELPPVDGFWSITMYNSKQFFEPNPINRYSIGLDDKLAFDGDGSLTLYFQHESPGPDKEANWLPSPMGPFNLLMRLYSPQTEILNGTWRPPTIRKEPAAPERIAA
jgi:hypothetical protein